MIFGRFLLFKARVVVEPEPTLVRRVLTSPCIAFHPLWESQVCDKTILTQLEGICKKKFKKFF